MAKPKSSIEKKLEQAKLNDTIKEYCQNTGHRKPVTRREFLASGLLSSTAFMFMPSIVNVLASSSAHALECPDDAATAMPAFVTINMSGGWSLAHNFIPRDASGAFLPDYSSIGLGAASDPNFATNHTTEFGNVTFYDPPAAGEGFIEGLRGAAGTAVANTSFVGMPVVSRDDSRDNTYDVSGMVAKAGLIGAKLPNLGTRDTRTGIGHMAANILPPVPLIVGNQADIDGAVGYTGALATNLNQTQRVKLTKTIRDLSASQTRKLASFSGGTNLKTLVECATNKNISLVAEGSTSLDPTGTGIDTIFNNNQQRAGVVYNALNGNAGPVGIDLGGYDYHGNARNVTQTRDFNSGQLVGQVLAAAAQMNKKVFIFIVSDGSVRWNGAADPESGQASGDSGNRGCVGMLAYDPAGRPATNGFQLGQFTAGQVVDNSFITGGDTAKAAAAVFANYLKFAGKLDLLNQTLPSVFSAADLNTVLKFV